jgi:hypothetical protein
MMMLRRERPLGRGFGGGFACVCVRARFGCAAARVSGVVVVRRRHQPQQYDDADDDERLIACPLSKRL